ncbi:MAG: LPS-assembly protein LptD [Vicingus serpentipes]|nr:LPS-assembly protein LptD [Vicingus serpentipes]
MKINFHTIFFIPFAKAIFVLLLLLSPLLNNAQIDSLKTDTLHTDTLQMDSLNTSPDALESTVRYNAKDSIRFDIKNQLVYLYGSSEVYYEDIVLKAEEVEINIDSNTVTARGKQDSLGRYFGEPIFTEAGKELKSHEIKYNFETEKGIITEAITHEGENYIHGDKIYKGADDILYIKNGKYTTCNLDDPHYFFKASKLKIIPKDKIITGPANMHIEKIPTPLAIPFGFFPNTDKQKSGLIVPSPGESAQYGFFLLEGGYYLGISDKLNMQLTGDFYSKGSWAGDFLSNYKKRYGYSGYLNARFSKFKNGDSEFPNYSEKQDFFLRWNHSQDPKARPNSVFSANVNFGTSENFRNNFNSSGADYLSTSFNSSISYKKSWAGKPYNLSINAYHSQNTLSKSVTVRLPEVAFNVARIYPFKRAVLVGKQKTYEKIGISYSMNAKNEVTAGDSLFSAEKLHLLSSEIKNGMKHTIPLSTSIKVLKHFTLNPSINYSEVWYLQSIHKDWDTKNNTLKTDTLTNFVRGNTYSTSANLTTKIYGMYQYRGKVIKALRHVITPSVGLSYTPENNSGLAYYTDSNNVKHEYSIFQNGIYGQSHTQEAGIINLSMLNNFEMKVRNRKDSLGADKKIKLLENLQFSSNYNMMADSLKWSSINIGARTNIFQRISLNFSGLLDPYQLDTNGNKINSSQWNKNQTIGRLTSANLAVSFSLKSKTKNQEEKTSNYGTEEELEYIRANPHAFIDFNVPWSLNVSYNIRYSKPQFKSQVVQTLNFSGDFSLTEKWKIGFNSGYDFETKDLSYTTVDIYRDLHCWEMHFNWIPFGARQSYLFTIKVKSAILQDLKLTRRDIPNIF